MVLFENILMIMPIKTHVRYLWEKVEFLYTFKLNNNKLYLLNYLLNFRYYEGSSISVNDFQRLLNQLSQLNINLDDEFLRLWLLNTLLEYREIFWV